MELECCGCVQLFIFGWNWFPELFGFVICRRAFVSSCSIMLPAGCNPNLAGKRGWGVVDCLLVSSSRENVVGLGIGLLGGQIGCSRNIDVGLWILPLLSLVKVCVQGGFGLECCCC